MECIYPWHHCRKIKIKKAGIYTLTAITSSSCTANAQFEIKVFPIPPKPDIYHDVGTKLYTTASAKSYQWYRNDTLMTGATGSAVNITDLATYKLEIFDNNKCSNFSDSYIVTTGVNDEIINESSINIIPNPTDGKINLTLGNFTGNAEVRITDVMGKEIFNGLYNADEKMMGIDLTNQSSGMYFVKVLINNKVFISKVIKN